MNLEAVWTESYDGCSSHYASMLVHVASDHQALVKEPLSFAVRAADLVKIKVVQRSPGTGNGWKQMCAPVLQVFQECARQFLHSGARTRLQLMPNDFYRKRINVRS